MSVKFTLVPEQTVSPGDTNMCMEGVISGCTVIVMLLLIAVSGVAQVAVLVSRQVITSPVDDAVVMYTVSLLTAAPFLYHNRVGEAPPFTVRALKETDVPAQIVSALAVIVMEGLSKGFTTRCVVALLAVSGVAHAAVLCSTQ